MHISDEIRNAIMGMDLVQLDKFEKMILDYLYIYSTDKQKVLELIAESRRSK